MDARSRKPLILFSGNCQAQHLAAAVKYSGVAEALYVGGDWGFLSTYNGTIPDILTDDNRDAPARAHAAGRRVILASQVGPVKNERFDSRVSPELIDREVSFPVMAMWSLSMQAFSDRFRVDCDPARAHEIVCAQNEVAQSRSGFPVDVASFIASEIARRPLFHTVNHPSGAVLGLLLRGLATLLSSELECAQLFEIADDWSTAEGLNYLTDHPVGSDIRKDLGWNWNDTYDDYSEMLQLTSDGRWRDLAKRCSIYHSRFGDDTQFWRCMALMGSAQRDDVVAGPAFERLLQLCPGVPGPWITYARHLLALGRRDDAEALIERALVLGNSSAYHGIAADVFALLGDLKASEMHARERWKRSPEEIRAAFSLINVLIQQRRDAELESLLASLTALPLTDRKLLDSYMARRRRVTQ